MQRKLILLSLLILFLTQLNVTSVYGSNHTNETTIDFFHGFKYSGTVMASTLDFSSAATELVKAVLGSDYYMSVYINVRKTSK